MIDFMVLGMPRSATTWVANLLTTDTTICLHDPLLEYRQSFLDQMVIPGKRIGISCTAMMLYPDWLAAHPARKVILYRNVAEVNSALERLALPHVDVRIFVKAVKRLPRVSLYPWDGVFDPRMASAMCAELGVPFCPYRHYELVKMNVQPQMNRLPVDPQAVRELVDRVREVTQ